eukprot:s47_g74.t1
MNAVGIRSDQVLLSCYVSQRHGCWTEVTKGAASCPLKRSWDIPGFQKLALDVSWGPVDVMAAIDVATLSPAVGSSQHVWHRQGLAIAEPRIAARPSSAWRNDRGSIAAATAAILLAASSARSKGLRRCRHASVVRRAADSPVVLEVKEVEANSTDEDQKKILKGLNLTIREGEVHAVMGPNGSGKSTLAKVLIGDSAYEVTTGSATLGESNLLDLEPHERALEGLFLAFQSPPAVSGVSNLDFLRAAYNAQRRVLDERLQM